MKSDISRLGFAKRNVISGILKILVNVILNFVIRTAIIYEMGEAYQGLSGLFSSILQVLNVSELGFSTAVTCILFEPISKNDMGSICSILKYLRRVYQIIGCAIFTVGLLTLPVLPHMIVETNSTDINIYALFLIYLFNSGISYFVFSYKGVLCSALQREDMVSNANMVSSLFSKIVQLLIIIFLKNYYLFAILIPFASIMNNLLINQWSKKQYPDYYPKGKIEKETRAELIKKVKAVFLNRLSDIARNSFDNIVISSFLGLTLVAAYDNYFYIFAAIYGFIGIIVHSIWAGVGNSLVEETKEKNYEDCLKFSFSFMWIVGWCSICLACLYQPFMRIWMKEKPELILATKDMLLFCAYFYALSMTYTKGVYLEAKGLFAECQKWYVLEALGNLLLNFILGYFFGITGILVATIITIVVFNFWGGSKVLFKYYFSFQPTVFLKKHILYFCITVLNCVCTFLLCNLIKDDSIRGLLIKVLVCLIVPNLIYYICYSKTKLFKESIKMVKRLVKV